ncbi:MAG: hypothetical protein IOD12_16985 [Silvanigrellales bacterium]|nr:hypothetical protein [Silvanigrellales bacterium]
MRPMPSLLSLLFIAGSVSAGGCGKRSKGTSPQPGLDANKTVVFSELAFLPSVNQIDTVGNLKGTRAFRFQVKSRSRFLVSRLSSSVSRCNGDGALQVNLKAMLDANTLKEGFLAQVRAGTGVELTPGYYSVTVGMNDSVQCEGIKVSFVAEMASIRLPDSQNSNTSGRSGNPGSSPPRPLTPAETEALRVNQGHLKPDTRLEFLAFASPSQGCAPVFSQTLQGLKKEAGVDSASTTPVSAVITSDTTFSQTVVLKRKPETASDVQLASLVSSAMDLLSFDFLRQEGYSENWQEKIKDDLVRLGGTVRYALDAECASDEILLVNSLTSPNSLPDSFRGKDTSSEDFPLAIRRTSAGLALPELNFSYSYDTPTTAKLKMEMKLDLAKILAQVDSVENVSSVSWMLGNRVDEIPLSNWNEIPVGDFFTPTGDVRVEMPTPSLASRALYRFSEKSFAFKLKVKKHTREVVQEKIYVVDPGYFCRLAYTRTDGADFHQSLFSDNTNPLWNSSPSRDLKTGCAYVGEQRI